LTQQTSVTEAVRIDGGLLQQTCYLDWSQLGVAGWEERECSEAWQRL